MGGPNTRKINPRWRTAAIWKKRKIALSQQQFDRLSPNLARLGLRILTLQTVLTIKILNFYKSKMVDGRHLEQSKNSQISDEPIEMPFGWLTRVDPRNHAYGVQILKEKEQFWGLTGPLRRIRPMSHCCGVRCKTQQRHQRYCWNRLHRSGLAGVTLSFPRETSVPCHATLPIVKILCTVVIIFYFYFQKYVSGIMGRCLFFAPKERHYTDEDEISHGRVDCRYSIPYPAVRSWPPKLQALHYEFCQ